MIRRTLLLAVWFLTGLTHFVIACPVLITYESLVSSPRGIYVMENWGETYKLFDSEGNFLHELVIPGGRILATSEDGKIWIEEFDGDANETRFGIYSPALELLQEVRLSDRWNATVTDDILYVSFADSGVLETVDPGSGLHQHYFKIEGASWWTIGEDGRICWTHEYGDVNDVQCANRNGEPLWTHKYFPSGSYLSMDNRNNVYVLGTIVENGDSGIVRIDATGRVTGHLPLEEEIFGLAVLNGDVFVANQDNFINRFNSSGVLTDSWSAIPPRFGEDWAEQKSRSFSSTQINADASIEDLVLAVAYGENKTANNARLWLLSRGKQSIPEIVQRCFSFLDYQTESLLSDLLEKMPQETIHEIGKYFAALSSDKKEVLADLLTMHIQPEVPGLQEFLQDQETSSDPDKRETAGIRLALLGWGEDRIEAILNGSLASEALDLELLLASNFSKVAPMVERALESPGDPLHEYVANAFSDYVESWLWAFEDEQHTSNSEKEILRRWLYSMDSQVATKAAMLLALSGDSDGLHRAWQAAQNDEEIRRDFWMALIGYARHNPEGAAPYIVQEASKDNANFLFAYSRLAREQALRTIPEASLESTDVSPALVLRPYIRLQLVSCSAAIDFVKEAENKPLSTPIYLVMEALASKIDCPEAKKAIRSNLLRALQNSNLQETERTYALTILSWVGKEEDSEIVMALPNPKTYRENDSLESSKLLAVSQLGCTLNTAPLLIPYLETAYALPAAAALSRIAYPEALPILLNAVGKKKPFRMSFAGHMFALYGAAAEKPLISMMESSDDSVRSEAIWLLADLGSNSGYHKIRKAFNSDLSTGHFPENTVIAALLRYGENPWEEILERLPDTDYCSDVKLMSFPEAAILPAIQHLTEWKVRSTDPALREKLECLLSRQAFREAIKYSTALELEFTEAVRYSPE